MQVGSFPLPSSLTICYPLEAPLKQQSPFCRIARSTCLNIGACTLAKTPKNFWLVVGAATLSQSTAAGAQKRPWRVLVTSLMTTLACALASSIPRLPSGDVSMAICRLGWRPQPPRRRCDSAKPDRLSLLSAGRAARTRTHTKLVGIPSSAT